MPTIARRTADLAAIAEHYVQNGGGLWIGSSLALCDPIAAIAHRYLDGKKLEAEMIRTFKGDAAAEDLVWAVATAWAEAGFAIGAAVGRIR